MLPADMGGGAADVRRGLMALSTFKKRVDDLLKAFEDSAGGSSKVASHGLSQAAFGMGNFPEAKALHLEYERVHERITSLSKSLGLQLEAMQIAVHGVDVTFDNLEEDLRYRFHEIRAEVNQEREEMLNEQAKRDNKADQTDAGY
ncbi:hypothetical protein ACIHAR_36110 [Streptomyces sp. NPDC052016]|uniref:hypothetical protein n=1 Tax=unclassified Streptomyces TaxID=2593676 RepID=UPI003433090D